MNIPAHHVSGVLEGEHKGDAICIIAWVEGVTPGHQPYYSNAYGWLPGEPAKYDDVIVLIDETKLHLSNGLYSMYLEEIERLAEKSLQKYFEERAAE